VKPLVISFYTDELYSRLASRLARSCEAYGLGVEIEEREDLGSWVANCGQKPTFILGMLEFHDRDVLWVDADAEFVSEPVGLDEQEGDLGLFITKWNLYMSGTLLFRNTVASREMLGGWIQEQKRFLDLPDEKTMRAVLERGGAVKTGQLSPGYAYVFDVWPHRYPDCKPIVLHKQASRIHEMAQRRFRPDRRVRSEGIHPEVREFNELCS